MLGSIKRTFKIEEVEFTEKFYVMKNTSFDILLGNDFFHKHFGNIDYETEMFTFRKNKTEKRTNTKMTQKIGSQLCTLFSTQELELVSQVDTIIPPKHEMLLNCILPVATRKTYQCKFGEIKGSETLFSTHRCMHGFQRFYILENKRKTERTGYEHHYNTHSNR